MLSECFSEVPELSERLEGDSEAIQGLAADREKAERERREWEEDITYSTEVGLLFKDGMSISPEGIRFKDRAFPLNSITRVRWGAIRRSVNGIPTGTTYTIAVGDNRSEASISFRDGNKFSAFIDKLWQAVAGRLLTEMLVALRDGRTLVFGDAEVTDHGVTVVKHKMFGANERIPLSWSQIHVWSADGNFIIGSQADKKTYSSLSYLETPNAHLLEHLIRTKFKGSYRTLSALLQR
jgi:hypothetical protein